jgi:hypothetical protein
MARKLAPGNKKAKQPPPKNTRSNSAGHKRPAVVPIDILADSSSDEEGVNRPKKDKVYTMSKKEFVEQMTLLNHPILKDEDQMERTFRYIDLANSMMRNSAKRREEMEDMEEAVGKEDERVRKIYKRDGPPFFRGDMSTTIMVNGVDQITRCRRARGWSQALTELFWENKVMVRDFWVVKKQGDAVVSVLVQTASRYQKILAIGAVNQARDHVSEDLSRMQCRVNVRDAFPKEQLEMVQEAYNRGYQLKKAGKIQAYRIYNQGGDEPVFEVRTAVDGKVTWGPPPPPSGDTPAGKARGRGRQGKERRTEDMETGDESVFQTEEGEGAIGGEAAEGVAAGGGC